VDAVLTLQPRTEEYLSPILTTCSAATGYRLGTKARQIIFSIIFYRAGTLTGKRERILQGMLKAVGSQGYEQTTVQDAIAEAGVYRQAFYDCFGDKEDCYLQALDAGSAWVELAMRDGAAAETTWRGRLQGALRSLLLFLDEQPAVGRALLVEVHAAGPGAVAKRTEAMARAASMMDLAREESSSAAPAISAEAVVAGILAVLHSRLASNQASGYLQLLPELMYLAVLPFFGAAEATAAMRTSGS
jgi:AcrR family transcriptional regulator